MITKNFPFCLKKYFYKIDVIDLQLFTHKSKCLIIYISKLTEGRHLKFLLVRKILVMTEMKDSSVNSPLYPEGDSDHENSIRVFLPRNHRIPPTLRATNLYDEEEKCLVFIN